MKNKSLIVLSVYIIAFLAMYSVAEISKLKNQLGSIDNTDLESQISELSDKVDDQETKVGDIEAEISQMDSRLDILEIYR